MLVRPLQELRDDLSNRDRRCGLDLTGHESMIGPERLILVRPQVEVFSAVEDIPALAGPPNERLAHESNSENGARFSAHFGASSS